VIGVLRVRFVAVLCALVAACSSSSNEPAGSALGESCARTADCQSGLACLANVCSAGGSHVAVDGGGSDGAAVDVASAADTESPDANVSRSADASDDQRLGQIGEVCQTTRDCAVGLGCVVSSGGASVCDLLSYGLMPSNKTCTGECSAAADCCALPPGLGLSGLDDAGLYVTVSNCQDILCGQHVGLQQWPLRVHGELSGDAGEYAGRMPVLDANAIRFEHHLRHAARQVPFWRQRLLDGCRLQRLARE